MPKLFTSNWRLRFGLGILFVIVTMCAVWLGYQFNWISQRRQSQQWIAETLTFDDLMQGVMKGTELDLDGEELAFERRPSYPFGLQLLDEPPRRFIRMKPSPNESEHNRRAGELQRLFPEAQVLPPSH